MKKLLAIIVELIPIVSILAFRIYCKSKWWEYNIYDGFNIFVLLLALFLLISERNLTVKIQQCDFSEHWIK